MCVDNLKRINKKLPKKQSGINEMSRNNAVVPQTREALDKFKMEAASEVGVQKHLQKQFITCENIFEN